MNVQDFSCGDSVRISSNGKRGVIRDIHLKTQELLIDTGDEQVLKYIDDVRPIHIESEDILRGLLGSQIWKEVSIRNTDGSLNTYFILQGAPLGVIILDPDQQYFYLAITLHNNTVYLDLIQNKDFEDYIMDVEDLGKIQ